MENDRSGTTRNRRTASIGVRLLAGVTVTLLAAAAGIGGLVMRWNGTHCGTYRAFSVECDVLTHRTIQLHCLVSTFAWAVAVGGLSLSPARAARCWGYATMLLLASWLTAHLIAYR